MDTKQLVEEFKIYKGKPNIEAKYKPTKLSLQENDSISTPVDLHIHSKFSTDGYLEIDQIVKRCMEQGVEWASITDHNSFQAIKELRQSEKHKAHKTYFDYDGVKIFTGVEGISFLAFFSFTIVIFSNLVLRASPYLSLIFSIFEINF